MNQIKPESCKKSIDKLTEIGRLRRIKNRDKLTKEDLIITLVK